MNSIKAPLKDSTNDAERNPIAIPSVVSLMPQSWNSTFSPGEKHALTKNKNKTNKTAIFE